MTAKFRDWYNKLYELPKGKEATWRPSAYAVVIENDKILLIHGKQHKMWTIPGGGMEITETMAEACEREVKEETGYNIRLQGDPVCIVDELYYAADEDRYYHTFGIVFKANITGEKEEHEDSYETDKVAWVSLDKLKDITLPPLSIKIFKKMGILK
ncbi:NUDIX domain-containing protein [Candidatus Woesearchaeota archaeon]|nr:NUDIX domain-containing protein [Candidatus Woesearchaeota archaeon]